MEDFSDECKSFWCLIEKDWWNSLEFCLCFLPFCSIASEIIENMEIVSFTIEQWAFKSWTL